MLQNPSEIKKTIDHILLEMGFKRTTNVYRKDFETHTGLIQFQSGTGSLLGLFTFNLSVCSSTQLIQDSSFRNIPGWEPIGSVLYGHDTWYKLPRDDAKLKEDLHKVEKELLQGKITRLFKDDQDVNFSGLGFQQTAETLE